MAQLDKSKPYGTVHGDVTGKRFEQGGVYFDGEGNEIGAPPKVRPDAAPKPETAAKADPIRDQLAKQ